MMSFLLRSRLFLGLVCSLFLLPVLTFGQLDSLSTNFLVIESPTQNFRTSASSVVVVGRLGVAAGSVFVNGEPVALGENQRFSVTLPLTLRGENLFTFSVFTPKRFLRQSKEVGVLTLQVIYDVPGDPYVASGNAPLVTLESPVENFVSRRDEVLFKGQAKGAEYLYVNDEPLDLSEDGAFFERFLLSQPNTYNVFVVQAISEQGVSTSVTRRVYFERPEIDAFRLVVTSPEENQVVTQDRVLFSGYALQSRSLSVNGYPVELDADGAFSIWRDLSEVNAYHTFELVALKEDGATASVTRKVFYEPDSSEQPVLTIESPVPGFVSTSDEVLFQGTAKHATEVWINEVPLDLDESGKFSYIARLDDENSYHLFNVIASSPGNLKTSQTRSVFYKVEEEASEDNDGDGDLSSRLSVPDPIQSSNRKPVIRVSKPDNNFMTYSDEIMLRGSVSNASEFMINDRLVELTPNGNFRESFKLKESGKNVFQLYAVADSGQATTVRWNVFKVSREVESSVGSDRVSKLLARRVSLELEGADIKDVLKILSKKSGLNIVADHTLSGEVNLVVKDVPLKNAIEYVLNTQGLAYKVVDNTILVAPASKLDVPTRLETQVVKLHNLPAEDIERVLQVYLTRGEKVQAVKQDNLLVIYSDPQKMNRLLALVERLDSQKVPQVYLEVQVIETSSTAFKELGINWPRSIGTGFEAVISNSGTTIRSTPSFTALINILQDKGQAKILARPQLKSIHDVEAEIFIGEKVPVVETTVDTTGRVAESVTFVDTGISMEVKPYINADTKEVRLELKPEVSVISGDRAGQPIIRTRKVNTTVWVQDGETVVIGGLFNSSDIGSNAKVPALGDIPLLGNLFKNKKSDKSQSELIITVTPRIVGRGADQN